MALPQRLASLTLEGCPSFAESLAAAAQLQSERQPGCDPQLAACRALVHSLPSSLPPGAAAQLVVLASSWLAAGPDAGSEDGQAQPAAAQLQAEAARLFLSLFRVSQVKLQSGACRQLLQQLCHLCRAAPSPAVTQPPPQPASSLAAVELACACFDLLAQLPSWYPQPPRAEVAAAVAAVAAALERQVQAAGQGGALPETPPTTRLLCKLLRALQVLLAEAKKDHGANAGSLALLLQRLFTYGWPQHGGRSSSHSPHAGGCLAAAPPVGGAASLPSPAPMAATLPLRTAPTAALPSNGAPPPSPGKYRPPHARSSGARELHAAASSASLRRSTANHANQGSLESSDSESSDAESVAGGEGGRHHASRVRSAALTCLQLLAKADPRSLHGSWTALLPASDVVQSGPRRSGAAGPPARAVGGASIAHLLLLDPHLRVRHAAAATLATLLEGPSQRAYLAVGEARDLERQPVRGFITLSASLGQMLVSLHQALLHSVEREQDALVLAATLRALGTLLLGAPYHRLPPQLLPLCVRALSGCLARTTPRGGAAALPPGLLPVASACLACLAAAFSGKDATAALAGQLVELAESSRGNVNSCAGAAANGTGSSSPGRSQPEQLPPPQQQHQQLLQLLFDCAACPHPALQLEALMALRGIAQQHAALLEGCWERLLALGRAGAALPSPSEPQSPRSQQGAADGTVPEKAAQQGVRLPGDFLQAAEGGQQAGCTGAPAAGTGGPSAAAAPPAAGASPVAPGLAVQWQQLAEQVLAPVVQHSSALLRAGAHAVVAGLSPAVFAALPQAVQGQLVGWCCAAAAEDQASPVRAAAARALGALAAAPALCTLRGGPAQVLAALSASCHDSVLAVRIPAAAALASLASMLSQAARSADTGGCPESAAGMASAAATAGAAALPTCLRLATAAAGDSDKTRPSGLQAVGSLFQLHAQLVGLDRKGAAAALPPAPQLQSLLGAAAQAVQDCVASGSARVQWAACDAAKALLACPPPEAQPDWAPLLQQLLALLRSSPNFRSRALAAAALRQLGCSAVSPAGSLLGFIEAVADVLFEGKASGFPAAPPAPGQQQEQRPRPEPTDLGSKAQLEASLVAAVLHLLSLLPHTHSGDLAPEGTVPSKHAAQLQRLVRQAQEELLQQPERARRDLFSPESGFEAGLFDLSQASAPLASAAAAGLALL
ncbi:hypothetical protein ABPG77_001323 [Micractinium sp. CCAP 211/92]